MTDKIIAFVDGSIYSASVCEHAAWAAERLGCGVEILHVLGRRDAPQNTDLSGQIKLGARSALMSELASLDEQRAKLVAHRGRAILEDAQEMVRSAGVEDVSVQLRNGDLVESLSEREGDARLILIGKRGEAADFAIDHLGSNMERLVRTASRPVLVASRAFKPIQKVLVAYDGGTSAMKAVDHLARSPLCAGLDVTVVTVGSATPAIEKGLANAAALLRAAGIEAQTRVVSGQPDTALGKLVDDEGFDMLVMGAYGHSRIRNLIIGSTSTAMVRSCKVPVLMIR
ncbi:universal stress protein [Sedimentimonas flavescens]|uniref:Universal stress protein n=1 Tax=Sedimentimonas flavescens TaxID=2851012 RepID=A0ABT2ZYU8_9RHOB|nr:universal stress protein [Sedimentimonas flavescens]MBW0158150.1 universal stress protein [Sedimentimonas flavescens]MCV2878918.1 universal stress protein [Sedimentimonas flavescens]